VKVSLAGFFGTLIDFYDFFIAAAISALVWTNLYFNFLSGAAAVGLAIMSFSVAFLTRPLGAFIFGHIGDRMGRKPVTVFTLVLSGVSTLGITLTPSYLSIGILAPILVILFRLIFGIGVGGETGGAQSWISEFADPKRRGFWNGIVYSGTALGSAVSAFTVILAIALTGKAFFDWGWRIAYGVGFLVAVVGIVIRRSVRESPLFSKLKEARTIKKAPVVEVFRNRPNAIALGALMIVAVLWPGQTLGNGPYAIGYMSAQGADAQLINQAVAFGAAVAAVAALLGGTLSDMFGRRAVIIGGIIILVFMNYGSFILMSSHVDALLYINTAIVLGAVYFSLGGSVTFFNEIFPTQYRVSGVGITYQLGAMTIGLLTGFVLPAYITATGGIMNSRPYAMGTGILIAILAIVGTLLLPETKGIDLNTVDAE
jgi:MFS family permease